NAKSVTTAANAATLPSGGVRSGGCLDGQKTKLRHNAVALSYSAETSHHRSGRFSTLSAGSSPVSEIPLPYPFPARRRQFLLQIRGECRKSSEPVVGPLLAQARNRPVDLLLAVHSPLVAALNRNMLINELAGGLPFIEFDHAHGEVH